MANDRYLTAGQAAAMLGVSIQTLYAYTSRGMLHSEPEPGRPRARRYPREDVERLKDRKETRHDPERAAARSLHWGGAVLESSITLIQEGRLYYRGRDAIDLAQHSTIEEVAALLWTGQPTDSDQLFAGVRNPQLDPLFSMFNDSENLGPIERCQIALPWIGANDLAALDLRPQAVAATGARILNLLVAAVTCVQPRWPIETALQEAWAPRRPGMRKALKAALILCADHELNVSAFAARCVASAAATPYDAVSAGLAALKGSRHGGMSSRVEALLREAGTPANAVETVAGRLRRGE
ncbi:MAG: citrate/2-methylcitrate synthase, partial [Blastocatellia bacterium]